MKLRRYITILVTLLCGCVAATAQDLTATLTPARNVLPPQIMYYLSNPGQYFNISLYNNGNEALPVYFGIELRQIAPSSDIEIIIPGRTMPKEAIVVPAKQVYNLNVVQMRTMFNHVRSEDIIMPAGLFDNVLSGTFGNLPEGTYQATLSVYKWDPTLTSPQLLNNPLQSTCTFTVCYQAKAPEWIAPVAMGGGGVSTLYANSPIFQWMPPVLNCSPTPRNYTYDLVIVQQTPMQNPIEAIERNPEVYRVNSLTLPQCVIPTNVMRNFSPYETYVAQITARTNASQEGSLEYMSIANGGKSEIRMFKVVDPAAAVPELPKDTVQTPKDSIEIITLGRDYVGDSLYAFVNPTIVTPSYNPDEGARKEFTNNDIAVVWRRPAYEGGRGNQPDSVRFVYDVRMYAANDYKAREAMLESKPIYTRTGIKELTDTIKWTDIEKSVAKGSYVLVQVKPHPTNLTSIEFLNDSINTVDFALTDRFSTRYFQCANQVEIENEHPTTLKAKDLKGKSVRIGEYELVLDGTLKDVSDKPGHFTGTGHVIWEPLLMTWKLAVRFDDIAINTENQVYSGTVVTHGGDKSRMTSAEVVEKLFSDWGIDNLIGDSGIPYASKLQGMADDKIKSLAEQIDLSKYYDEVTKGYAKVTGLLSGNVEDVTFPLEIPKEINNTPVNLQIATMKFAPTYATMDLIGTFVVPETKATKNQILVFGSPRMCISPKSLIPEGGTVALLKDFTVKDPSTDYDLTFKAPNDVITPENGCFVSWSQNKFEMLNLDMDMTLPNLRKVSGGSATEQCPKMHLTASVTDWEDWLATGTIDPFEHEDLPGYVFTTDQVIVDYSNSRNDSGMGAFPKEYKLEDAGLSTKAPNEWRGLYMKELSMEFPKSIKIGNGKERMKVAVKDLFIDKSGITLDAGIVNAINYSTGENGTIGGFKFSLDKIYVSVIQNNFNKFGFDGQLEIPLFKGTVDYSCSIYNQRFTEKGGGKGYAYVFKTTQIEDLNFDFMLGDLTLDKKLTYFLVEAIDDEVGETKTNVELLVGGEVTIAGTETVNKKLAKLPMDLHLPGIKFCKMRLANNKSFESVYERSLQTASEERIAEITADDKITWWNEAEDLELGTAATPFYLNLGQWGYASPQKKIGPFEFALTDYDFSLKSEGSDKVLGITLGGSITFNKAMKLTAGTAIEIQSRILNIDDISNISLEYKDIKFRKATFGISTIGFKFDGELEAIEDGTNKGYGGTLDIEVAGGLFQCKATGGYYDYKSGNDSFSWGYFEMEVGGKMGIPVAPLSLTDLHGGFYFNCVKKVEGSGKNAVVKPQPKEGIIGVIAGIGLQTLADQGATFDGNFDCTVVYDKEKSRLSTFMFNGKVKCLAGLIDSKVSLIYENNESDKYFQLNVTADVSANGAVKEFADKVTKEIGGLTDKLKELNDEFEGVISDATGSLDAIKDNPDGKTDFDSNMKKYEEKEKKDTGKSSGNKVKGPSAKATLDIRITSRSNGKQYNPVKWHVYLGEPEKDKRCQFILVDFKGKVVNVSIGADAYLCIGNELPGDGKLPPIPEKVREFLDGKSRGGVTSDNITKATSARRNVENLFKEGTNGGVMIGASVWGYIDVDLGLFYGDMGATAGFDISVVRLSDNAVCVNTNGKPGYNGWYGMGQLYAYLYAKFGFKINLGFFKKKVDLLDAGVGGVFECALPNPNYFTGKARVKLRLLGGLVKIDKSFSFECGKVCELFMGNALDDYQLFDNFSIGSEKPEDADKAKIDYALVSNPTISTSADLGVEIDVVDPTELNTLKQQARYQDYQDGQLELLANRKFAFELVDGKELILLEFASLDNAKRGVGGVQIPFEYFVRNNTIVLQQLKLKPSKYYRLSANGRALEKRSGVWKDPETFDEDKGEYRSTPWTQTKHFYFATNDNVQTYSHDDDLSKHAKLAFPARIDPYTNEFQYVVEKITGHMTTALECDVKQPRISFAAPSKGRLYNKGTLQWELKVGNQVYTRDNTWVENDSISIMYPSSIFPITKAQCRGKQTTLRLWYRWKETVNTEGSWVVVKSYTAYGASREAVYKAELRNNGISTTSTGTPKLPSTSGRLSGTRTRTTTLPATSHKRLEVEQEEYLNLTESGNNLKFKVTVYEFKKGNITVDREKLLFSQNIHFYDGEETFENLYKSNWWSSYWRRFMATRVDAVRPYLSIPSMTNGALLGGGTRTSRFATATRDGRTYKRVAQSPYMYLSYLGNMYFIGGYQFNSGPKNLNYHITTMSTLKLSTPYMDWPMVTGTQRDVGDYRTNASSISNSAVTIRNMSYFGPSIYNGTLQQSGAQGTPYPLYTGSANETGALIGGIESGVYNYHPLDEETHIQIAKSFHEATKAFSDKVHSFASTMMSFKGDKAKARQWIGLYGASKVIVSDSKGYFGISVPKYQFPIMWMGSEEGRKAGLSLAADVKVDKGVYRAPRVDDTDFSKFVWYSGISGSLWTKPAGWVNENVEYESTTKWVDEFYFTRYRVNAWNFKKGMWTFSSGNQWSTAGMDIFYKHYTKKIYNSNFAY